MSRPLREVITYVVIAFALAIGVAVALPHADFGVLLSALLPAITVLVLTFTITPRAERRRLWGSFGFNTSGKSVWWIALGVPVLLPLAAYGVAVLCGAAELRPWPSSPGLVSGAFDIVSNLALMVIIFLGEEIGWRGYVLPRIQQLTSRRRAALVTGFVHGCFHLPLILIATTYDQFGSRWFVAPMVVAVLTSGGVFYAYLWDRSHSVWTISLAHSAVNLAFAYGAAAVIGSETTLAYVAGESGVATFAAVAVLAAVLLTRAEVWRSPASAVAEDRSPALV
jgi:membrane protease YdiL (CAAX protease family)